MTHRNTGIALVMAVAGMIGCTPDVRNYNTGPEGAGGTGGSSSSTAATGGSGGASSSSSSSSSSTGSTVRYAYRPLPPAPGRFMWQGTQRDFVDDLGQPCSSRIALAVGDQAVCYAAAGGTLRCAGKIFDSDFGPTFADVPGVTGVDQILISLTSNAANHNGLCVRTIENEAHCMGNANDQGQFGNGTKTSTPAFLPWGPLGDIEAIATGTWDQICALTTSGLAACAGYNFDTLPKSIGNNTSTLWIDTFGSANLDDATTFRAANGRTECKISAKGLECSVVTLGTAGDVVDGNYTSNYDAPGVPPGTELYCHLDGDGRAWSQLHDPFDPPQSLGPPTPIFTQQPVLMLAGNPYTSSLCAVYVDGSIACLGNNDRGQLGISGETYIVNEVVVQPPGSVDTVCK